MRSQTFEASTTVQQQWTILTRVMHVSITAINTTQETIGFFRSSESTKIRQGCTILVHERGEHRATRTEHWQRRGGLLRHYSRLPQTVIAGLCGGNQAAPLGLAIHSQMKIVVSTILRVHDPNVGFGEERIKVQSFGSRFRARNHSADTRLTVMSKSARFLVQSNKRSERSAMNDEPDRRIVVPAADDPRGHHDARFA
jgi:hypothetical protein